MKQEIDVWAKRGKNWRGVELVFVGQGRLSKSKQIIHDDPYYLFEKLFAGLDLSEPTRIRLTAEEIR